MPSCLDCFITESHDFLLNGSKKEIDEARSYLNETRKISDKSIHTHKIGYWPKYEPIPDEVKFYGKKEEDRDGNGYSYFIQNRVIVPIYDEFGKVVGFATRRPTTEPGNTWWNLSSPFKKGNHLFLLDKSRKNVFNKNKIYLVEGYVDAIILYQEKLEEVCSLMGVHLSPRKIGLIVRYCDSICICLDTDKNRAGQDACEKAIYTLNQFGFSKSISTISLPLKEDPDEYVMKNGLDDFLSLEKKLSKKEVEKICKRVYRRNKKR